MARNKYPEETVRLILEQSLKLFMEKGYENTSIQDIIDNLGGLSKGAIYHHFKSKGEISDAVCKKMGEENAVFYRQIRDDVSKNGLEKLKALLVGAYSNPNNDTLFAIAGGNIDDPKILLNEIVESFEDVAPNYVQPIIEQGVRDGSIKTDYPKELAEVVITLLNVWMNPLIVKATDAEVVGKFNFFNVLLQGLGIDVLDEEMIDGLILHCQRYNK